MYLTVRSGISPLGDVLVTTYDGGVMIDDAEFAKHVIKEIGM